MMPRRIVRRLAASCLLSLSAAAFLGCSSDDGAGGSGGNGGMGGASFAGNLGNAGSAVSGSSGAMGGSAGSPGEAGRGGAGAGGAGAGGSSAGVGGTSTAGSSGSPGGAGAGGGATGGGYEVCKFASGLNIAWVNFANDVPNPDLAAFHTIFKNTHDAGGRIIRWWFHTNGSVTPGYDANGMTKPLPQAHIDGVKQILSAAQTDGVKIVLSLWSFDMLQDNAGAAHTNNQSLLEKDANRQAYVDNYLTPLVAALKGNPALYAWEIFNEPEGMTATGWATYRTTEASVQKTVNWLAAAIHTADPSALVTNAAQTFDANSTVGGKHNYYSDSALREAGGKQNGTLDFYEVHYYTANGASNSCFTHPASYWALDKKLVMGEFFAQATEGVEQNDTYTHLYDAGYNGAWAWSYNADQKWPTMQQPMKNVASAHADVGTCP